MLSHPEHPPRPFCDLFPHSTDGIGQVRPAANGHPQDFFHDALRLLGLLRRHPFFHLWRRYSVLRERNRLLVHDVVPLQQLTQVGGLTQQQTPFMAFELVPTKPHPTPHGDLPLERSTSLVELYSDISYAPQGEKSVQGIVAMVAGATLQWETSRQSYLALSTAEAELYSYVEALTMGDSLQALWTEVRGETPEIVTYGGSQAAISIVRNPDGPWRTRHLRLRANVLRERAQQGRWTWRARS